MSRDVPADNPANKADNAENNESRAESRTDGIAVRAELANLLGQLKRIRVPLLNVHKALLDQERFAYEAVHGQIEGQGTFLNLVMTDPWFDWLHRISQMVVRIDELTETKPETDTDFGRVYMLADQVMTEARNLFRPQETSQSARDREFSARYKAILQRSSSAVLAHSELLKALFADN